MYIFLTEFYLFPTSALHTYLKVLHWTVAENLRNPTVGQTKWL